MREKVSYYTLNEGPLEF